MASRSYLDTHVVVWLYSGRARALTEKARRALRGAKIYVSPIVVLEIDLLREIGRVYESGETMVSYLENRIGLERSLTTFERVVAEASRQSWTNDPFDRIVVGEASIHDAALITKDSLIHDHYPQAVW